MSRRLTTALSAVAAAALLAAAAGCGGTSSASATPGNSAAQGKQLIETFGCGACHTISGVQGADGKVGPSLDGIAERRYIAGRLPNSPQNLARWIGSPQEIDPGTVMPDLGVGPWPARDIAAYLDDN